MYEIHNKLVEYIKKYETGGMDIRSKKSQLYWVEGLKCKIIKLEQNLPPEEELKIVLGEIDKKNN